MIMIRVSGEYVGELGSWTILIKVRMLCSYLSSSTCCGDGERQASFAPKKIVRNWILGGGTRDGGED